MDFNIEVRRIQLESLEQFIASSKEKVQHVLQTINWDSENVLKDNKLITCSLDTNHKIPQKSADVHIKKCILRKEGYSLNEQFLSEPSSNPKSTILIDDHKKIEVLSEAHKTVPNFKSRWNGQDPDPKTSDRLMTTFSTDERLALYNYTACMTTGPDTLPEYDITQPKYVDKPLTYEEQLIIERDAKRRRVKYKSVHTSHKNHTEVLREVIESQMELLKDWVDEAQDNKTVDNDISITQVDKEEIQVDTRSMSRNSSISNSSRSTRKDIKREPSDTESFSRRSSSERDKKRTVDHSSEVVEQNHKNSEEYRSGHYDEYKNRRRDDYRKKRYDLKRDYDNYSERKFENRERRDYGRDKYERYRRSPSRETYKSRRNGYKEYRRS